MSPRNAAALLATATLAAAAASAQRLTRVATGRELKEAVRAGALHIELTAHLDLSRDDDVRAASGSRVRSVTHFTDPNFQTFRGNCAAPPPQLPQGSPAAQPAQCVITTAAHASLFEWSEASRAAQPVWIDNVYVDGRRGSTPWSPQQVDLIVWAPRGSLGPALYATNYVAALPDGLRSGGLYARRRALAQGCTFFNTGDHGVWTAAPVALLDSRFANAAPPRGAALPAAIKASGWELSLQRLTFEQFAAHDVFVPADSRVSIYTDTAGLSPGVGPRSVVSVVAAAQAPASLPTPSDQAFMRLREDVAAAGGAPYRDPRTPLSAGASRPRLGAGGIAGIVLGGVVAWLVVCGACSLHRRRAARRRREKVAKASGLSDAELGAARRESGSQLDGTALVTLATSAAAVLSPGARPAKLASPTYVQGDPRHKARSDASPGISADVQAGFTGVDTVTGSLDAASAWLAGCPESRFGESSSADRHRSGRIVSSQEHSQASVP